MEVSVGKGSYERTQFSAMWHISVVFSCDDVMLCFIQFLLLENNKLQKTITAMVDFLIFKGFFYFMIKRMKIELNAKISPPGNSALEE